MSAGEPWSDDDLDCADDSLAAFFRQALVPPCELVPCEVLTIEHDSEVGVEEDALVQEEEWALAQGQADFAAQELEQGECCEAAEAEGAEEGAQWEDVDLLLAESSEMVAAQFEEEGQEKGEDGMALESVAAEAEDTGSAVEAWEACAASENASAASEETTTVACEQEFFRTGVSEQPDEEHPSPPEHCWTGSDGFTDGVSLNSVVPSKQPSLDMMLASQRQPPKAPPMPPLSPVQAQRAEADAPLESVELLAPDWCLAPVSMFRQPAPRRKVEVEGGSFESIQQEQPQVTTTISHSNSLACPDDVAITPPISCASDEAETALVVDAAQSVDTGEPPCSEGWPKAARREIPPPPTPMPREMSLPSTQPLNLQRIRMVPRPPPYPPPPAVPYPVMATRPEVVGFANVWPMTPCFMAPGTLPSLSSPHTLGGLCASFPASPILWAASQVPSAALSGFESPTAPATLGEQAMLWNAHVGRQGAVVVSNCQVSQGGMWPGGPRATPVNLHTMEVCLSPPSSMEAAAEALAAAFAREGPEEPEAKRSRCGDHLDAATSSPSSWVPPPPPRLDFGPLLPDVPRQGWLPAKTACRRCRKSVVDKGGVFCGRRRRLSSSADPSTAVLQEAKSGGFSEVGCGAAVCWRCMNRAPHEELGKIRTTKAEFASLGDAAWWMHEFCMGPEDRLDYFRSPCGDADAPSVESVCAADGGVARESGASCESREGTASDGRFEWE